MEAKAVAATSAICVSASSSLALFEAASLVLRALLQDHSPMRVEGNDPPRAMPLE